ncbi:MAG: type II toxin-antitoxin system RelE/ParE family toxin [Oscillospiraceae bacterium]|nr:type II toxin-antitoxin system RelE/ParE family toxin [Oscillospiraceae bacterium]
MNREFVYTRTFLSNWKAVGFDDNDLANLEQMLLENPKAGPVIRGTGSARKVRFAFEGQGKSGSARVIYVDFEVGEKICCLAAYAKSTKDNLTEEEKKILKNTIEILGDIYNS